MPYSISPIHPSELDACLNLHWESFSPPDKDMIMPMLFPHGPQPDLLTRLRSRILTSTNNDPAPWFFACKDTSTDTIAGIAWWGTVLDAPVDREGIERGYEVAREERMGGVSVEGANEELVEAFNRTVYFSEAETMMGRGGYVILKLLAVGTGYQRQGIGSMLLRDGFERFDGLGLPTYLDSGVSGKGLYERFGFVAESEWPLDCRKYGGRSKGRHWCMVRPAQRKEV